MVGTLRSALGGLDPAVLWLQAEPLAARLDPQLRPWRLGASVIGGFGGLALLIAAVGLYSLIAHQVASRAHELGVRQALGARGAELVLLVLRRGLGLAGVGVALGVVLAAAAAPRLRALLFHTSPHDPLVFVSVVASLLGAAVVACIVPARRALTVDPAVALRDE